MKFRLGLRGKIALLTFVSTAACAFVVAWWLAGQTQELLREHEIVDLKDEGHLRAWEMVDRINALREDSRKIATNPDFLAAVSQTTQGTENPTELAKKIAPRLWARYLGVEIISIDSAGTLVSETELETKIELADDAIRWIPETTETLAQGDVALSPITRINIKGTTESSRPFVWSVTPLPDSATAEKRFLRILMWLPRPLSARHIFALADSSGKMLMHSEELIKDAKPNEKALLQLASSGTIKELFKKASETDAEIENKQVEPLAMVERQPLPITPFFQEGQPDEKLQAALDTSDPAKLRIFSEKLAKRAEHLGRFGDITVQTPVVRAFAWNPEDLGKLQQILSEALAGEFGANFDGITWQSPTKCTSSTIWSFRIKADSIEGEVPYLLLYGVLDEELAYGIRREMGTLWKMAFLIALTAGAIAFAVSVFFIRPLQKMTQMSRAVVGSKPGKLLENLTKLSGALPVTRRDEVGDIARSSKLLFDELIHAHQDLDRRVQERTQKLNGAKLELQEANERLQSLNRDKDLFVAKISHNLRQPLNAIYLEVETCLLLHDPNEEQEEVLKSIQGHAQRQEDMVKEILNYQKIIMGSEVLTKSEIEISEFTKNLADSHRTTAENNGNKLSVELGENVDKIEADHLSLTKILDNLLTNACKFTKDGVVTIAAKAREIDGTGWIEFSIEDNGAGMSPDEQAKAFTPFVYRKKGNASGNGLGLVISKELCEQMGGRIGFVSEVGKGTRFSILLPVIATGDRYGNPDLSRNYGTPVATTTESLAEEIAVAGDQALNRTGKILIIDDDQTARNLLTGLLEKQGYTVITAEDGAQGLKLALEQKPDVITLDVVMPGKDGWEVLAELKAHSETSSIPVVMVSVMADRSRGLAHGVTDVLVKPIDIKQLSKVIQRSVGHSSQRNILVIDDDTASRSLLCDLIRHDGWHTIEASDGKEALDILERTLPAAIILDLMMPVMDGFDFLSTFEQRTGSENIPVLVVTGKATTPEETAFLRGRVEQIIQKGGGTAESVVERIHSLLPNSPPLKN